MSDTELKSDLAHADLIREIVHAEDGRRKRFVAIVRFVRHGEASGPAKDMTQQIRSDQQLCKMLVDYETQSEIIGMMEFVSAFKNQGAASHVASNRTVICLLTTRSQIGAP